jgi:hypothetical protein
MTAGTLLQARAAEEKRAAEEEKLRERKEAAVAALSRPSTRGRALCPIDQRKLQR